MTLAGDNPDYPADAQPIIVIYRNRFEGDDEYMVFPSTTRSTGPSFSKAVTLAGYR